MVEEVINKYLYLYNLDKKQMEKLNNLRKMAGLEAITKTINSFVYVNSEKELYLLNDGTPCAVKAACTV